MTADASAVFVDSNVLVYAYDSSAGAKHARAEELVGQLWRDQRGALSVQVLQEFFVTVTSKIKRPLAVSEARRIVSNIGRWRTHEPTAEDVVEAIDIYRGYKISFWDAMIVRSAMQTDCDVLWTEDLNPGQRYRGVRAENPFT